MHFDYPEQSNSQRKTQASVDSILPVMKRKAANVSPANVQKGKTYRAIDNVSGADSTVKILSKTRETNNDSRYDMVDKPSDEYVIEVQLEDGSIDTWYLNKNDQVFSEVSTEANKKTIARRYTVYYLDELGEVITTTEKGDSPDDVRRKLENKGMEVVDVEEMQVAASKRTAANHVTIKGNDIPELKGATGELLKEGNIDGYKGYLIALDEPQPELAETYTNFLPNDDTGFDEYQEKAENAPGKYVLIFSYDIRKRKASKRTASSYTATAIAFHVNNPVDEQFVADLTDKYKKQIEQAFTGNIKGVEDDSKYGDPIVDGDLYEDFAIGIYFNSPVSEEDIEAKLDPIVNTIAQQIDGDVFVDIEYDDPVDDDDDDDDDDDILDPKVRVIKEYTDPSTGIVIKPGEEYILSRYPLGGLSHPTNAFVEIKVGDDWVEIPTHDDDGEAILKYFERKAKRGHYDSEYATKLTQNKSKKTAAIAKQPFDKRPSSWHVDANAEGGIHLMRQEEE